MITDRATIELTSMADTAMRLLLLLLSVIAIGSTPLLADRNPRLIPVAPKEFSELFEWTDTCNVFLIKDGDAALFIDLGDGGVLDHLQEVGVKHVESVLFTSHHRELCQGYGRLKASAEGAGAKIAASEGGRALFENP